MTKMQSNAMRTRQRIGAMMANRAVIIDPANSAEETRTLPAPAVKTEDFVHSEEKIWGQACKIAILSLFFACSFQNFISSQYSADGSLHQPPRNPSSIADQKEILYIRFQGW
jgi:hypothetical protein